MLMASRCGGPPIRAKQWFVRIDAWAERRRARTDDNETLRRAGHCNRSTMRLLGSSVPYARRVSLPRGDGEIRERKAGTKETEPANSEEERDSA